MVQDLLLNTISDQFFRPDWEALSVGDWQRLPGLAEAAGISPLLYQILKKHQFPLTPEVQQALEKSYYLNIAHNQVFKAELDRLSLDFHQAGIALVPLKGAALAWTIYPDPALRPMNDLDLLVQPGDLLPAIRLSQALGYRLDKLTYHALLRGGPEYSISLELHWCLPGGRALPPLAEIYSPDVFEQFTYLYCAEHLRHQHAANPRLIWVYDLLLLRMRLSDDANLASLANRLGFPAELAACDPAWLPTLPPGQQDIRLDITKALRLLPKRARLRLLVWLLFPSPAYMKWRYKPRVEWMWPVYYPRRVLEWAGKLPNGA
jgi:hypothetical protein